MNQSLQPLLRALLVALIILAGSGAPLAASAAEFHQQQEPADSYTFADMGLGERTLTGPIDTTSFQFSLPAQWRLTEGTEARLALQVYLGDTSGVAAEAASGQDLEGSQLSVEFNGRRIATIELDKSGPREVAVPVPESALQPGGDGRYALRISLDSRADCDASNIVEVAIGSGSTMVLPHEEVDVPMQLDRLPRPFFQRTFFPEQALIVVPNQPTQEELQSAMTIAAGFGRMSGNRLQLGVRRAADLTRKEYASSHLLLVGKPGGLPLIGELELPVALKSEHFAADKLGADDGVVQLVASPWDDTRGVLVVSGNTDTGVLKAAQATAAGQLLVDEKRAFSIVSDVQPATIEVNELGAYTLDDLGYERQRMSGVGYGLLSYDFFIPEGYTVDEDAAFDLQFTHSRLLDYGLSGVTVLVNDSSVGSVRLSDETSGPSTSRFSIPGSAVHPGRNQLALRANLIPRATCYEEQETDLWFEVWPESLVSLPLRETRASSFRSLSLAEYPRPFTQSPNLRSSALIVPAADAASWETAAMVAADLGSRMNSSFVQIGAAFADAVPAELRETHDLIIIGRASSLPIVAELNQALPAPFEGEGDRAINRRTNVIFSPAQERSEGYLQLLTAPWDGEHMILAIMGTDDASVRQAAAVLSQPAQRAQLGGNFTLVVGDQLIVGGNRITARPDPAAAAEATAPAAAVPTQDFSGAQPPQAANSLLIPLVLSVSLILAILGAVVGITWRRNSRR